VPTSRRSCVSPKAIQADALTSNALNCYEPPLGGMRHIGLFLPDVGLAILLIRKLAAAHLAGFACCVPTISNGPPIGYRFLNVTRRYIVHDLHSFGSARLGVTLRPGAGTGICIAGARIVSESLKRSRMGAPNFSGIAVGCGKSADHCSSTSSAALAWITKPRTIATAQAAIFFKTGAPMCAGGSIIDLSGTSACRWI
jgi:hypothetical protein